MKKIIFPLGLIFFFLIFKAANNSIRLSDTNTYFNVAYQMSQGKILYKDIFFSNFPLFQYTSFAYYSLGSKSLEFFYLTSCIEVAIITLFIYLITYKKTKNYLISILSCFLYIFSFMLLSTSDHQTGVFTASLFGVLSYLFLQRKKYLISGILIAATVFTKAYFLPILLAFSLYVLSKREWKNLLRFCLGFAIAGLIILTPSLVQSPQQLISDIFGFSLTRPAGLVKMDILWFFITKDFLFFILLFFNLFNIRKNLLFGLVSVFTIIFFFGYQDVYYLYLNFLAPFLCLSFYEGYYFLKKNFNLQHFVIPTIILFFVILNLFTYVLHYKDLGKIQDIDKIIKTIKAEKPRFLYGAIEITPALIAMTNVPALENVNGAHEYFFERGIYDKKSLTKKAVENKTILVTNGANYPEYNIQQDILDNIFVKEDIYKNCKKILSVPAFSEGSSNRINLFKCY